MRLPLILCAAPLAIALGAPQGVQATAPVTGTSVPCAQVGAAIAANKAEAAHLRTAAEQLTRIGSTDPSVRVAITRDGRKANDLDKQNAALHQQLASCPGA